MRAPLRKDATGSPIRVAPADIKRPLNWGIVILKLYVTSITASAAGDRICVTASDTDTPAIHDLYIAQVH